MDITHGPTRFVPFGPQQTNMAMMANKHGNDGNDGNDGNNGSARFVPFGPQQTNMAMMATPRTTTTRPLQVCGKIFLNTLAINVRDISPQ